MNINPMNFVFNLKYMLFGMLTIFAVIGIIVIITMLLNKFSHGRE
ncbi:oxaloacetate decarboxylase [Qingrenia yutianensis]|uniref:Oxaloacetate decarboxylase n=1 Tax=Qingrenia yutianensis TaxID=2763676 RepID=A0A926FEJ8_9FIRM|nr:oxaloacetate decarboxylase [Qingrenia yutianensis]MBC8596844.1 oxaloacetate decarboxylase [Qingrenia yutianensis]